MMTKVVNGLNINIVSVGRLGTNCYIIYNDSKEAIIIDAGANADIIKEEVENLGVKPVAMLLTHGHFDHIMAVNELADYYDIPVYAGASELRLLTDGELNGSKYYVRRSYTVEKYELLKDLSHIVLGGIDIEVIFTPGHTEGSVCYYVSDAGVLFTGDTLFRESVGRTDMPTGDDRLIIESLNKLVKLSDDIIVYPGHGDDSKIGYERVNNPYIG
jgi:glyoxylase-like metal-dependent hydrolase (beta-lactamase superfamily II)